MKNFQAPKCALFLAALASVWMAASSAAAVDDAPFAEAMDAASSAIATVKNPITKTVPRLEAPDEVWQKIMAAAKSKGKYSPLNPPIPAGFILSDIRGDEKADHSADYVGVFGSVDDEGKFHAMIVNFVSELWKMGPKDGNWHIDQWIFKTDVYGGVEKSDHQTLIERPDRTIVSANMDKLAAADPRVKAKYDALIKLWSAAQP